MKNEKILEGNRLILEFEGFKFVSDDTEAYPNGYYYKKDEGYHTLEECRFNESWDWLMEVIKKCLDKNTEDLEDWQYHYECITDSLFQVEIKQTYQEVIKFIKWYNNEQIKC